MDHLGDGNACSLDLLVGGFRYEPHPEFNSTIWFEGVVSDLSFWQNEDTYLGPLVAHDDVRLVGVLVFVQLLDVLLLLVVQFFLHD